MINGIISDRLSPRSPNHFDHLSAYGQSKLCLIMFIAEFRRNYPRLLSNKNERFFFFFDNLEFFFIEIYAVACHPGNAIYSDLTRNSYLYRFLIFISRPFSKSMVKKKSTQFDDCFSLSFSNKQQQHRSFVLLCNVF